MHIFKDLSITKNLKYTFFNLRFFLKFVFV